jgi:hypothetical protein
VLIDFKKKEELPSEFLSEGIIIIYDNKIFSTNENSFDNFSKEIAKKTKVSQTNILGDGIQLVFRKDKEKVYVAENRRMDLVRFASKSSICFNLLKEHFK